MQADSPFLLSTLMIGKMPFIIKEMQPTESKISFGSHHKHDINKNLIDEMIHVLVHDQLSACDIARYDVICPKVAIGYFVYSLRTTIC
jgi:hypothetical protein